MMRECGHTPLCATEAQCAEQYAVFQRVASMQCAVDATAKLAAVRQVLGERHTQWGSQCGSGCVVTEPVYGNAQTAPWPCLHERVRRAVEGEQ